MRPFQTPIVAAGLLWMGASLVGCGKPPVPPAAASPAHGEQTVTLSPVQQGGQVDVAWSCGKSMVVGDSTRALEIHRGYWRDVNGTLVWNPIRKSISRIELRFATASFQSDNDALTNVVIRDQQWFDTGHFPEAQFIAKQITPRTHESYASIPSIHRWPIKGWTHVIHGTFSLNGVEKDLNIPAKVDFRADSVRIEADFAISRAEFKVEKHKDSLGAAALGSLFAIDDRVQLSVALDTAPLEVRQAAQLQAQKEDLRNLRESLGRERAEARRAQSEVENRLADLEDLTQRLRQTNLARLSTKDLPKSFADVLVEKPIEKDYARDGHRQHFSYKGLKAPFKMILVPGDPTKGIAPFYMGETEVTWDLFHHWSCWYDAPLEECVRETEQKLRPSNTESYMDLSHNGQQYDGYPAMSMSRLTAEKFCLYLSKKTGRNYRLPTEAEWDRAYALGGGDPKDDADKLKSAVCKENSDDALDDSLDQVEKTYLPRVGKVKTKRPNALGLYDMLGNVAEWVKTPGGADRDGKNTFVRGGDFMTPVAQLSGARREQSDNDVWNATYPNKPASIWWFKDHYQVGFRLVCEPVNLPKP